MADKTLLFDIGNVLVTFDFNRAINAIAPQCDVGAESMLSVIADIKDHLEGGLMHEDDFFAQAIQRIGYRGTRQELEHAWCDIFAVNEPMLATLRALPPGLRMLHLSNTNAPHKNWLFTQYPDVFGHFEGGTYSHEVACMKPHDEIYQRVIADFHLSPENTFYIDDLLANIEGGRRWGLHSHHYDPADHPRFQDALDQWLQN